LRVPDSELLVGAAHPEIASRRLYLRDDNKLFCYNIREQASDESLAIPWKIVFEAPPAITANVPREGTLRSVLVPPQDIVEKMLKLATVKTTDVVDDPGSQIQP